jgi:hypothetical protein
MKPLFLFLFLIAQIQLWAQDFLLPTRKNGKWGAVDTKGALIIDYKYDFIGDFANGVAIVKKNRKTGIVNTEGTELIPPTQYERIQLFDNQLAAVYQNELGGIAETNGEIRIAPQFELIIPFANTFFKTYKNEKFGIINPQGSILLANEYESIDEFGEKPITIVTKEKKQGIFTKTGKLAVAPIYDKISIIAETAEFLQVRADKPKAITLFYFDKQGNHLEAKKQEFNNETHLKQTQKAELAKAQQKILQTPDAKKPRWIQEGFDFKLTDAIGRNLLDTLVFWDLGYDEKSKLTLARRVKKETIGKDLKETDECYLIDSDNAKIIFKTNAKDVMIYDYNFSKYARLTIDTLWDGLIDKQGNIIRSVNYAGKDYKIQNVGNFSDGLAWVLSAGKYGYINGEAKAVIGFDYEVAADFTNGKAIARKAGAFGCIDTKGTEIIPFMYQGIDAPTTDGAVRVKKGKGAEGKWGVVNLKNVVIAPFEYTLIYPYQNGQAQAVKNGKFGVLDTKGKEIVPFTVNADMLFPFNQGIALIGIGKYIEEEKGEKIEKYKFYGYIDQKANTIVAPEFNTIEDFETIYKNKQGVTKIAVNGKVGYLNYLGNVVIPPVYEAITGFEKAWNNHRGLAKIQKQGKIGYIDRNGNTVVEPLYDSIDNFEKIYQDSTGTTRAVLNGKYGTLNHKGSVVIPFEFDGLSEERNSQYIAKKGTKFGVIDNKGTPVVKFEYDGIRLSKDSSALVYEVFINQSQTFFIDENGNISKEVTPSTSKEEVTIISKNNKFGLQNAAGKIILKPTYDEIQPFSEGLACVSILQKNERKYGYIDQTGKLVIATQFTLAGSFSEGKAPVNARAKWGYIDKIGTFIIQPQFNSAMPFSSGIAIVNNNQLIDEKGKIIGNLTLSGQIKTNFQQKRAVVQSVTGEYHIKPNGLPAYLTKYDEVTEFVGDIAFAKRGEMWELTREVNGKPVKLTFTKSKKLMYLEEYGKNRKEKDKTKGEIMLDKEWKIINPGKWRMIDQDGNMLNEVVFEEVTQTKSGFTVRIAQQYGLLNSKGETILAPQNQVVRPISKGIFRVEKEGNIAYIKNDGTWLVKF